ncbi:hypothetical protein [Streptococcus infantis]|uniref:hypothetical protein n=1 Tax=Streptococcus infantis TaxID=68892 RepID=UPI0039C395B3
MRLLLSAIVVGIILNLARKRNNIPNSKRSKDIKIAIIIVCVLIAISPVLILMEMWGLFAHASRNELEQAVHRSYKNYGLTGQFELEEYEKNYTSVGGFVIHGTYSENIDGKTYQANSRFEYYTRPSENKKYKKTDAEVDYEQNKKIYQTFPELAYLGIEISPGTSEFLKTLDTSITDPKMTALKYDGIDFQFNSKSGNMYLYDEILEENQRKGQALQGMYPMDAQYLFQKDIFIPEFQFRYYTPEDKKDQLYDAYLEDLESQMKEFFNNQPLPSGLYAVKIDKYEGDKLVNNSGVHYVKIENRQVVEFIKDLY